MKRSHSRSTTKFDTWPSGVHESRKAQEVVGRGDFTPKQRQTHKKLQKRKQRQYDKKISRPDDL